MALTIDATVGGIATNSYVTVAETDAYHEEHLYGTAWTSADAEKKKAAIIWASKLLDDQVTWRGFKYNLDQALGWPRSNAFDRDNQFIDVDEIPKGVKRAAMEMARLLLESDRTAAAGTEGFSKIKVGSIELAIDSNDRIDVLPDHVLAMLQEFVLRTAQDSTARLLRV